MKKLKYLVVLLFALFGYVIIGKSNVWATDYVALYDSLFESGTFTINSDVAITDSTSLRNELYNILYYNYQKSFSTSTTYTVYQVEPNNCNFDNLTCDVELRRGFSENGQYNSETLKTYENIVLTINSNISQDFTMVQNDTLTIDYPEDLIANENERNTVISNYLMNFDSNGENSINYRYNQYIQPVCITKIEYNGYTGNLPSKVTRKVVNNVVFSYTEADYSDDFKQFSSGTFTIKSDTDITRDILQSAIPSFNTLNFQIDGNISNNKVMIKMGSWVNGNFQESERHLITLIKDENIDLDLYDIPGYRTSFTIAAAVPTNPYSYVMNYSNATSRSYSVNENEHYSFTTIFEGYNSADYVIVKYERRNYNTGLYQTQFHRIPVVFSGYSNTVSEEYSNTFGEEITINSDSLDMDSIQNGLNNYSYNARVLGCNSDYSYCDISLYDENNRTIEIHNLHIILDNTVSDEFIDEFNIENDSLEIIMGNGVTLNYGNFYHYIYNDQTQNSLSYNCNLDDGSNTTGQCRLNMMNYAINKNETHTFPFTIVRSDPTDAFLALAKAELDIYPGESTDYWNRLSYSNELFTKDGSYKSTVRPLQCSTNNSTCSVIIYSAGHLEIQNVRINIKQGRSTEFDEAFSGDTLEINSIYLDNEEFLYRASQGTLSSKTKSWSYLQNFNNNTANLIFNNLESHTMNIVYAEGNQAHKQVIDSIIEDIDNDDRVIKASSVKKNNKENTVESSDNIAFDTFIIKVDDLEFINSFYNDLSIDAIGSGSYNSKIINDEIGSLINNKHVSYFFSIDGGLGDGLYEVTGGKLVLYYDGIAYGIANQFFEIAMDHILYIPDDTAETTEAYVAAAQQRVDNYLGENSGVKIEFLRTEENPLHSDQYMDPTGSNNNIYRITYQGREKMLLIIKDSSKIKNSTFIASDVNTSVNVSSDNAVYPANTLVSSNIITDNQTYNQYISNAGLTNVLVIDIDLFSPTIGQIEEFNGEEFDVEVPIDTSLLNNRELKAIYINDNGTVEEHQIVLDDFIAKFSTNHFSTYAIVEKEGNTTPVDTISITSNPSTVDFGEVYVNFNENVSRTLTITNNGNVSVTLSITNPTGSGPFGSIGFDNSHVLAPNESFDITVIANKSSSFAGIVGNYEGTYVITATEVNGTRTATVEVDASVVLSPIPEAGISYTTHIQNIGWQDYVSNGAMAGTQGLSLRLEGIKVKLDNQDYPGDIEYRTHIENIGWETSFKKNNEMSGTSGRSYRLEAIELRLTGEMAEHYDLYYRVHAQNFGWLGWARNGESSGTAGYAYRLEGIEIKLVPKGEKMSGYGKSVIFYDKNQGSITPIPDDAKVSYTTHVQNVGWQNYVYDGNMAGTQGKSLRLEGIKVKLLNQDYTGNIEYRTHIQNIGWETEFKKNDEMSGTSGKSLRLEAIEIKLTGEMAEHFDIYYRVHAQNFGWLGWAKNGEQAGTAGFAYRLEGIEIKLVPKGETPTNISLGLKAFYQK